MWGSSQCLPLQSCGQGLRGQAFQPHSAACCLRGGAAHSETAALENRPPPGRQNVRREGTPPAEAVIQAAVQSLPWAFVPEPAQTRVSPLWRRPGYISDKPEVGHELLAPCFMASAAGGPHLAGRAVSWLLFKLDSGPRHKLSPTPCRRGDGLEGKMCPSILEVVSRFQSPRPSLGSPPDAVASCCHLTHGHVGKSPVPGAGHYQCGS